VPHAVGFVYGEPLLVAACCASFGWQTRPGLAAIQRAPHVVTKCLQEAEIEKTTYLIGVQHRIAAKDIIFQDTGKRPRRAAIRRVSIAGLPEVGLYAIELPPTDCHFAPVRWINCNRRLVGSVADDVVAIGVDVYLKAGEGAEPRDHSRQSLYFPRTSRRVVVFFEWLCPGALVRGSLGRSDGKPNQRNQTDEKTCV
jgi:hypothetical protein